MSTSGPYAQMQQQDEDAASGDAEPPPLADKQTQKYARLTQQHSKANQLPSSIAAESNGGASISPTDGSPLSQPLVHDSGSTEPSEQPLDSALDFPLTDATDAASDDDAAASASAAAAASGSPRPHSSLLYLSSLGLLLCWVANNVLWLYVSDYFGVMYAFFQNQITAVIYLLICLPLVGWRWKRGMVPPEARAALPHRVTMIMGACDAVYNLLTSLASPRTSGPMQNLLFQLPVPLSMLFLKLAWPGQERSRFTRGEYLGATVIVVGAIVSLLPQLMQSPDSDASPSSSPSTDDDDSVPVPDNNAVSLLIYVVGVCFYTLGSVYKESALKAHASIDCSYVSLVENVWALLFGFVLVPMLWLPGVGTDKPGNTWTHFRDGAHCMFRREDPAPNPQAQCANIWWISCVWIVSNVGVNVLGLIVVRSGDAVYYNLSSSVQLPITNLLFTSSFVMTSALATTIDPAMWAGLAIVCAGVAIYHFVSWEPKHKDKQKAGGKQQQLQRQEHAHTEQSRLQLQLQQDEKRRSLLHGGEESQVASPSASASLFAPPSPSSGSSFSSPSPSPSLTHDHLQLRSLAINSAATPRSSPEQSGPG